MAGRDARREIGRVASVRNRSGIDEAAIAQPGSAIHRHSNGLVPILAGGEKLDAVGVRLQLALVDDNFEAMAAVLGFYLERAERDAAPSRGELLLPTGDFESEVAFPLGTRGISGGGRQVVILGILAHRATGGKGRREARHAFTNASQPFRRKPGLIAFVEFGYNLLFERV